MTMHNRTWVVTDVDTVDKLVAKLLDQCWTPCTGFRFDELLFLNDSTAPGRLQEYAVILEDELVQVESITVDWMDPIDVEKVVQYCNMYRTEPAERPMNIPVNPELETEQQHDNCYWCT